MRRARGRAREGFHEGDDRRWGVGRLGTRPWLPLLLAATLGACTEIDDMLARVPIFAFMRESPGFDPYEAPRLPPEHAVAFEGPTGQVPAPFEASEAGLQAFGAANANPIPRSPDSEARGEVMYARYCQICHGPEGMGGNTGTVTSTGVYPPIVPPVAAGRATTLSDGYIYGIIRVGRGLMPAYAVQVPHEDRWHIVNYLRSLQGGVPAAAQAGGAGANGIGTADTGNGTADTGTGTADAGAGVAGPGAGG